jgi:hypothetical protein
MPPSIVRDQEGKTRPSLLLALLAALIVSAFDRRWLSGPVQGFIPAGGPSPERLSRLKARLLDPFEALVVEATRRGRPPREPEKPDESLILRELLALVPRGTWTYLPRTQRRALVAAQERLKREHSLSERRFCELLGISERTFRSWKTTPPPAPPKPAPERETEREKPAPRNGAGRFDLEVTLPGIQAVADTTSWELFGVPLVIVAAQDPGDRKLELWDGFAVSTEEDSELVVKVLEEVAGEKPGLQIVNDQGTPYMAELTREAIEELECEQAPQKEGTPTEKATKERAFRTVKDALAPLVKLSRKLAERIPSLRNPELAKALGRIVLSVFLRVYAAAPRNGAHPLNGRGASELEAIAQEQRERARAEDRSKRLLLAEIHQAYDFPGSPARTIRAHRRHALEDIQEAERRLRRRACRCVTRACDRYFAGILRNVAEEGRRRRALERRQRLERAKAERQREEQRREAEQRERTLRESPEIIIVSSLDLIARQWNPQSHQLLAGGKGLGTLRLREAIAALRSADAYTSRDRVESGWKLWLEKQAVKDDARVASIRKVIDELLASFTSSETSSIEDLVRDRMQIRPRSRTRPPVRGSDLRNYEAGSWG